MLPAAPVDDAAAAIVVNNRPTTSQAEWEERMANLGERIREARLRTGLTLRALAREAGVSPSFVSQIENGKSQPSVATLYGFAKILNISVDELFDSTADPRTLVDGWGPEGNKNPVNVWSPTEFSTRVSIIHPSHRAHLEMADGVSWERLASTPEQGMAFMKIVYAPGATSTAGGDLVGHEGYEYGYVLKGTLEVAIGSEVFTLHEGDTLGFDSTIPHVLRNVGQSEFQGVWFVHSRRHGAPGFL